MRYCVTFEGCEIGVWKDPECSAARYLVDNGLASREDTLRTFRGETPCLRGSVGWYADRRVVEATASACTMSTTVQTPSPRLDVAGKNRPRRRGRCPRSLKPPKRIKSGLKPRLPHKTRKTCISTPARVERAPAFSTCNCGGSNCNFEWGETALRGVFGVGQIDCRHGPVWILRP